MNESLLDWKLWLLSLVIVDNMRETAKSHSELLCGGKYVEVSKATNYKRMGSHTWLNSLYC